MDFFNNEIEHYLHGQSSSLNELPASLNAAFDILMCGFNMGRKVLTCGNGGSALDAQHLASELVNRFENARPALAAVSLGLDSAVVTSIANDLDYGQVFSRQIAALGHKGDILVVFSTSGNSVNVLNAVEQAHLQGMRVIACTGKNGGNLAKILNRYDVELRVSSEKTARIQEIHLFIIHMLCQAIDNFFVQSSLRTSGKIELCWNNLSQLTKGLRPLVFTNGVFDLLHRGHIHMLKESRQLGSYLVVGVNSDASVRRLHKGANRPIQREEDRMAILASLDCVDLVTMFTEDTPAQLINQLMPDVLVKGGDYAADEIIGAREVMASGGQVITIPFKYPRSTTQLVASCSA
jgi:phosphoheptose isomerase